MRKLAMKKAKKALDEAEPLRHIVVACLKIGKTVFTRTNSRKTAPYMSMCSHGKKEQLHAEVALLKRFVGEDLRGPLLVARYGRGNGGFLMAKPCPYCESFIKQHFPNLEVYYTDRLGDERKLA